MRNRVSAISCSHAYWQFGQAMFFRIHFSFDALTIAPSTDCSNEPPPLSFLFTNTFERLRIGFLIDKSSVLSITLNPTVVRGVIGLRAPLDRAVSMSVTCWWIGSHDLLSPQIVIPPAIVISDAQVGFPDKSGLPPNAD